MKEELKFEYNKTRLVIIYLLLLVVVSSIVLLIAYFLVNVKNPLSLLIILCILCAIDLYLLINKLKEFNKFETFIICNKDGITCKQYFNHPIYWKDIKGFEVVWINKYHNIGILTDSYNPEVFEVDGKRYYLIPSVDCKDKPRHIVEDLDLYMHTIKKIKLKK